MIGPRARTRAGPPPSRCSRAERPADLYDAWLFAAADATLALEAWRTAVVDGRGDTYAAYVAALDREDAAASRLRLRLAAESGHGSRRQRRARELDVEPRVTLLDALREQLGLTGTKKGCDQGGAAPAPCWSTAGGCSPA